ncbi:outer membrane lipoprotein Slp [Pseudoxanthomonas suwonensis 11-1]|uniref:Outer membrane lipoprotein Slp n=1 Tax=Pseudoxanthomonas suwonensis (strain 11-1) TaxID=743721 RepID=E6WUS6_PSEUU|nr:Slp family lipoprotein [Pseudoxanthomonas suwonensis]ADV27850.1 outer membrane lipoprotein Slp [Pseudoxanthomonas suwonensis 11-1]
MTLRNTVRFLTAAAGLSLLAACATAPQPLQGSFPQVTPQQAVAATPGSSPVRWGGRIVETQPKQDRTCFQMVAMPLNATGRPQSNSADVTQGRFVACRAGFYDPAVFTPGREVTFVGRVEGTESVRIGEYDYHLPQLAADVVYLWPEVREVEVVVPPYPYGPYGRPYWGPYRAGWGGWWW